MVGRVNVTITVSTLTAEVQLDAGDKPAVAIVKRLVPAQAREHDPAGGVWIISERFVHDVAAALKAGGREVSIHRQTRAVWS